MLCGLNQRRQQPEFQSEVSETRTEKRLTQNAFESCVTSGTTCTPPQGTELMQSPRIRASPVITSGYVRCKQESSNELQVASSGHCRAAVGAALRAEFRNRCSGEEETQAPSRRSLGRITAPPNRNPRRDRYASCREEDSVDCAIVQFEWSNAIDGNDNT